MAVSAGVHGGKCPHLCPLLLLANASLAVRAGSEQAKRYTRVRRGPRIFGPSTIRLVVDPLDRSHLECFAHSLRRRLGHVWVPGGGRRFAPAIGSLGRRPNRQEVSSVNRDSSPLVFRFAAAIAKLT